MNGILEEFKWETLQIRIGGRIIGSYYCTKVCKVTLKFLQMNLSQNKTLQISTLNGPSVKTHIRKASFPKLSGTGITSPILISAAELLDNCVSKFTSLVRARD